MIESHSFIKIGIHEKKKRYLVLTDISYAINVLISLHILSSEATL